MNENYNINNYYYDYYDDEDIQWQHCLAAAEAELALYRKDPGIRQKERDTGNFNCPLAL